MKFLNFEIFFLAEQALIKDMEKVIPPAEKKAIVANTKLDQLLYAAALKIFVKRVKIMADATRKPVFYNLVHSYEKSMGENLTLWENVYRGKSHNS